MAANPIRLTYEGTTYTLCYTRKTAKMAEAAGFNANEIDSKPNVMIPMLYQYAFKAHHPWLKTDLMDEIYAQITNRTKFIEALANQYNDTVMSLMGEPEKTEGNATWEMT